MAMVSRAEFIQSSVTDAARIIQQPFIVAIRLSGMLRPAIRVYIGYPRGDYGGSTPPPLHLQSLRFKCVRVCI